MKRFTIPAVVLGVLVLSLFIARPALTGPQDEKKPAELPKLEQLQKERIDTLQKIADLAQQQYKAGNGPFADLAKCNKAQEKLIKAKLEATEDSGERIALLEEQVKLAQSTFDFYLKRQAIGLTTSEIEPLQAKAHLLRIEIKLAKERAKAKPAG